MRNRANMASAPSRGGGSGRSMASSGSGGNNNHFETVVGYERPPGAAGKVGKSLSNLLMGPFVVFLGCTLLWFNEEWAIKTHRSLNEALEAFETIDDATMTPPDQLRGKLVHLTHQLQTDHAVVDPLFGLSRKNAVSLRRDVEIYQWVENIEEKKVKKGDVTEVREIVKYNKKWVSSPISSDDFRHVEGHENCCGQLPMETEQFQASKVTMGAYLLANVLTQQISRSNSISATEIKTLPAGAEQAGTAIYLPRGGGGASSSATSSKTKALPDPPSDHSSATDHLIQESTMKMDGQERTMYVVKATGESFSTRDKALAAALIKETTMRIDGQERTMYLVRASGESFSTRDKALAAAKSELETSKQSQQQVSSSSERRMAVGTDPEIGDVRVTFSEVPCTLVSVLAKLSATSGTNNLLTQWTSRQGSGYTVAELSYGAVSAVDMIGAAQSANSIRTWMFRGGGWLLNVIGFSMITDIISTTADVTLNWIPLLGPMAHSLINLGVSIANVILANCTTMLVASIAWVFYRPVLGISLLVGSLGLFVTASHMGKAKGGGGGTIYFDESKRS